MDTFVCPRALDIVSNRPSHNILREPQGGLAVCAGSIAENTRCHAMASSLSQIRLAWKYWKCLHRGYVWFQLPTIVPGGGGWVLFIFRHPAISHTKDILDYCLWSLRVGFQGFGTAVRQTTASREAQAPNAAQ